MTQEAEQAFALKRTLKSLVYTLKVTLIDLQATLIKSQTEKRRSFDRNYSLSEKFLNKREEFKKASETYEEICQKLNAELDRIDCRRMIELEQCLNRSLKSLLDAQTQVHYYILFDLSPFSKHSLYFSVSPPIFENLDN